MLISAVLLGCGLGLGLGASYLAAGLGKPASTTPAVAEVLQYRVTNDLQEAAPADAAPALDLRGPQAGDARQLAQPISARRDLDCLTQAVYFEARGEGRRGQAAVATVVLNRVKSPRFPKTVCGVVYQGARTRGCQFSFACDGSMHRGRETAAWNNARRVAARALAGVVLADVGRATHFHTTAVAPAWGLRMTRVAQVGMHVFYKPGAPARTATPVEAEAQRAVFVSLPAKSGPAADLHLVSSVAEALPAAVAKPAKAVAAAPGAAATATPAAPALAAAVIPAVAKTAPPRPASAVAKGATGAAKTAVAAPRPTDAKVSVSARDTEATVS